MIICTVRLKLRPLNEADMAAIRADDRDGRGWSPDYPAAPDLLLASLASQVPATQSEDRSPESPPSIWGPWQIQVRGGGLVVGAAGFKGPPDQQAEVEIGYGLVASARGQGYATEAVQALVELAARNAVSAVTADTAVDNVASQRVLIRCGFTAVAEGRSHLGPVLWWRRELGG